LKPSRSVAETRISYIAPKLGSTDVKIYSLKEESAGMGTAMIRALKQLREENTLLKEAVSDLTLENAMLNDVIRTVVLRFAPGERPSLGMVER
jgi:hypothetical protein